MQQPVRGPRFTLAARLTLLTLFVVADEFTLMLADFFDTMGTMTAIGLRPLAWPET